MGNFAGELRTKSPLGRANIRASSVVDQGLGIEADDELAKHAEIIGWPDDEMRILEKATELAAASVLIINVSEVTPRG
ncbi:MAG: hypothetical protein ABSG73_11025 [Candidatus Aminicenantales bacterium]